jgi:integrase
MKLSPHAVRTEQLGAGQSERIIFDDDIPGFGLRLRERGSRTFVFQYKLGAKQRRITLGTASALAISKVRKTAEGLYARVKLGQDPATDKAEAQRQASETFKPCSDKFLEALRDRYRPRAFKEIERHLIKNAKPLHQLQVAKIARRDIASLMETVTKTNGPVTANRMRTSLSAFFSWAIQRDRAAVNPVVGTEKNKEQSRDRVLTPAELRLIWNALEADQYGAIVKLLALTGQRESEIGGLCRSEIHDQTIVLPPDRTKNGRPHVVPLSKLAAEIIEGQPDRDERELIFGNGEGPFSGWSKSKDRLDERLTKANGGKPIAHWTLHDLRRTFATYVGGGLPAHQFEKLPKRDKDFARGVEQQPHIIEAILNHVSGHKAGVAGIYQRGTYEKEKRIALDLWANHLLAIVGDKTSNVTPLRRGA